jgi:outer membrane protein OmpA-like peptidoglycan-associated protein
MGRKGKESVMHVHELRLRSTLWLALATAALGCATSFPPPQELTDARVAYVRASQGPAAQLNGARLQLARQALEDAEMAYGAKSQDEVRDRAYVALRKIQTAETEAVTMLAAQRRERALRELATLQGVYADRARAELAEAENRAAGAGARAQVAEGQLGAEQARTQVAQQQALVEQQRADSERQGRLAAEARADQALADLAHMANVKREQRGLVITLSGQVLFASNEATLLPAATKSLDNVVAALKGVPANAGKVMIEGHTDARGARAYNRDLAERRARAVRDYLVSRGMPADLFSIDGVGPDRPVADNRSAEGRANNRRVEIVLPPGAFASSNIGTDSNSASQPASTPQRAPAPTATAPTQTTLPGQLPAPASTAPQAPTPTSVPPAGSPGSPDRYPYPQQPGAPVPAYPR